MFEIDFSVKSILIYILGMILIIDSFLTGFLVYHGLGVIGSLLFCTPISVGLVGIFAVVGALAFHVHRKTNS